MRFTHPAGLWALALAVPVVVLHLLRPRRQQIEVSSTFLWRELATPVATARPWQRLRPTLLLLLQLLAVAGLAVGLARPVRLTAAPVADHTVFIVDASGSMAARDGDPDRLATAKAEARRLRGEVPAGGVASIVVADTRPRVVLTASPDRGEFADALGPIRATPGPADFAGAFALAEGLETPGQTIAFVLLSDGGLTDAEQALLPPGTEYRPVGEQSTNRAITRLVVEPRAGGLHAIATVRNTGGPKSTQTLRLDVDGRTVAEEVVALGAGDVVDVELDLPPGERIEAFLEGEDLLDADDHVVAVAPGRRQVKVLLAGPDDPFLEALLAAIPGVEMHRSPAADGAPDDIDVAIYNQVAVPDEPPAPFWAIAPPRGVPGVTVTGEVAQPAPTLVRADDGLLLDVDLSEIGINAAQRLEAPVAETLVADEGTPLLLRGTVGEQPFVYLGFVPTDSDLPVVPAFPILGDRIIGELTGGGTPPAALDAGTSLPLDSSRAHVVEGPGGLRIDVPAGAPAPHADRPGFWTIATEGRPERTVAVNAAARESDLKPAPSLLAPERTTRPGESAPRGHVPVLAWVVVPLLLVLAAEWWLSRRRSGVSRRQFRVATALRVLIALALVGALLDLAVVRPAHRVATMFVIDASDSLGPGGQSEAVAWVQDALDHMPSDARAGVALFGGDARLELTLQSEVQLGQPAVQIDPSRTDLAGALRLAAAVLPGDARRRVVLVSDGRPTQGDAMAEAERLAAAGIPVDVHVVGRQVGPDAAVVRVQAPGTASEGETIPVRAVVHADRPGPALVALLQDGTVVDERTVDLVAGDNEVSFRIRAGTPGLARFQVRVTTASDAVRQNDVGYAAVRVEGRPSVLLLEGRTDGGALLAEVLRAGAVDVTVAPAAAMPPLDELSGYSSIVLVDVDARTLTGDQVGALSAAVRDLGRGLVSVGGTQSYGLGGYLGSELEQLLPVVSDILDPERRQTVAQVLAIDTSGSMGACHCAEDANGIPSAGNRIGGGINKTDIARAGAARAVEALAAHDEVGILAVDTTERWVLDLQQLPAEEVVTSGLAELRPTSAGTDLSRSLSEAAEALRDSKRSLKHIILFTDGFTDPWELEGLADEAADLHDEGITVSVLATGEGSAAELEAIAEAGGGRFYPGRNLQEIPQIMQQEVTIASRDFVNEGEFLPTITSSAAPVRDLDATPPLLGYIATTAKPQAMTHLRIGPDQDPLLTSWNVGLGRVTSWTSDQGDRWGQTWASWDGFVDFWSGLVKDTFPRSGTGGGVSSRIEDGMLHIAVVADDAFPEGSAATARISGPDGQPRDVRLERTAGDTFAAQVPVTDAGSYAVAATVSDETSSEPVMTGTALASLSYSAEYEPGDGDPALLARVSERTGGRGEIDAAQAFDRDGLRPGRSRIPLAGWLLLAAALLWPVAVATSRLALAGSAARQVRYAGATAVWWLRERLPALPGRSAGTDGSAESGRQRSERPERPEPPRPTRPEREPAEETPQVADSLGALLASKRRRAEGDD